MISQLINPNKLIDSYIETIIQSISLLNMRIQYRSSSDTHNSYNSSELMSCYAELYVSVFGFSSIDSDFNRLNVSASPLDKENLIKLHELILNNISVWLEFPNSQEFLTHYLYEKSFSEFYKRPAILFLFANLIKLTSFSDKSCKESLIKILRPSSSKEDQKKDKLGNTSLTPKEKIIDTIMSRNFFWDSKYMMLGNLHFIEALLSLQDYDIAIAVYNTFEKNLKNIYDEIRGDLQDDNLIQVIFLKIIIIFIDRSKKNRNLQLIN